ncbi:hypothetical protein E6C67_21190 [Azospirillum sp. TSA2s]|uniref:hypothetical protein n=1 Tax=Azospirillum sp. TSA2s TaxID=709810 RepID=UPI0010AA8A5E|nr:hypothetical protein [Azospirillum sp. TSA2s]QCG96328.1 hypothetical protein E6C67_21190 [Azospirillum sp. TSA2s]
MTNYINTHSQTDIDTEYQNMMVHLEVAQRKLLAKYGMNNTDIPALMWKLMFSFDGNLPEMSREDERRFLIYSAMLEMKKNIEAVEKSNRANDEVVDLLCEINQLQNHIEYLVDGQNFARWES